MESIPGTDLVRAAAFHGAGIAMGDCAIGPDVGEGYTGGKTFGRNPGEAGLLTRSMPVALLLTFVV
ncbi:MAG: ATP synthase F0 subunit C [Desulfomonilia bacterium]|jgi:F-type H+-transporting ATPase subunit c|uniref:ATP synthase subunit c n=1 Tax=anaerobic digester metagenome TaxID=1263854 RepID=A0A485LXM7_9ZZZZ|nr:ATP synthase F0 subunit C [Pseudomonadota bacterium]HON38156.1 ATP synthase F0 subunit C [Deltaproteobacteria bacterium]HRS56405.1 ATP synthase F0 subunit C [Desulfomonilia bacterium]HPD21477.1 ATP synthase F0 subunit C [Deltaproteobacteria bacterium]HPX18066.1 ATP synthase F0 subunit C [Deltaproteobacteria bacterium]